MKQPVARGKQSDEKRRDERKGKEEPGKIASVYTQAAAKPSLLRDGYIFWQGSMLVKSLDALESKSSGGFAQDEMRGHTVVGRVQLVFPNQFFESGKCGKREL